MRLDCHVLHQVQVVYHVLPLASQFYLATVRRTQVLALLFHQMCLGVCLHQHSQVCYVFIAQTLVNANFVLRNLRTLKSPNAVFCYLLLVLLLSPDLDRLIGEGVTLCGQACFNTTCSLATVLKGGADCDQNITARLRPWDRAVDLTSGRFLGLWQGLW